MLNTDPVLIRCESTGAVLNNRDEPTGPWSYSTRDSVGELGVSEARMDVTPNFTSGAKVEILGGRGSGRLLEKPSPTLLLFSDIVVFGDSSWMSFMTAGLGDLDLPDGPRVVGTSEIRTQFCRRWPLRALGLPFRADGFPEDSGAGSHWKGLPLLLLDDEACVEA
jgi:hypothetical protein